MRAFLLFTLHAVMLSPTQWLSAETFTIREDDGNVAVIDARLIGEQKGLFALERADGRIEFIPQAQLISRTPGPDPKPISSDEMISRLKDKFGEDNLRAFAKGPFVIALVLSEPLEKEYEKNAEFCLKTGADFMKRVEQGFTEFANDLKLAPEKSRFPLVVLVFETDDDFSRFHSKETGGRGLSSEMTQGYYNRLTNHLVIRMSECYTFATPLHEAIHQQVYNRGILERLLQVPVWFDEGIATGFEGDGNGGRIKNGPKRINSRYARRAFHSTTVNWEDVITRDEVFRGDVLAGDAYSHAWSIHWLLVTKYRKKYPEYLQTLREKPLFQVDDARTRIEDIERVFGKRIADLQNEFPMWLNHAAQKEGLTFQETDRVGYLSRQSNLAEVEMTAVKSDTGELEAEGLMRNISMVRPMSFHITMETDGGTYAEWHVPDVKPSRQAAAAVPLTRQIAKKKMEGSPGFGGENFQIKVRSVVPGSEIDREWKRGKLPVPVWKNAP